MNQEIPAKQLYHQEQLPVFQNRMYDTEAESYGRYQVYGQDHTLSGIKTGSA